MVSRTALMLAKVNVKPRLCAKAWVSPRTAAPLRAAGCTRRASALLTFPAEPPSRKRGGIDEIQHCLNLFPCASKQQ